MRETAEYALKAILRDQLADSLEVRLKRFQALEGRRPATLLELVTTGLVRSIPQDPLGGEYFLDPETGAVLSTSAVADEADRSKRYVERLIGRYRDQQGHYPRSLSDLEKSGLVESVPSVPGTLAEYDSATGTVEYVLTRDGSK
jgi:hypothetical protein